MTTHRHCIIYITPIMSITLKEFSLLIIDFINKTFVPLLQSTNAQHEKALDRWHSASKMISEVEKYDYWALDSCLASKPAPQSIIVPQMCIETNNSEISRPTSSPYRAYQYYFDKNKSIVSNFSGDEGSRIKDNIKDSMRDRDILSRTPNKDVLKENNSKPAYLRTVQSSHQSKKYDPLEKMSTQSDSFQKLITSFRKLCSNFEANHRKLLRQDYRHRQYQSGNLQY